MTRSINLLFTMNRNYVMPCMVALTSIFENDKDSSFQVFLLHSGITDFEIKKINELREKYNHNIIEKKVEDKYFSGADYKRWSKETYYRLLVNEYIPKDFERILYLDCDIIVTDSLFKFYNIDMQDKYIAAPIWENTINQGSRLGLPEGSIYFPAGFILYNLKKVNEIFNYENIKNIINKNKDRLVFADMDLLNLLLYDKVRLFKKDFYYIGEDKDFKETAPPSIIHYSASKPWHNLIRGRYDDIWLKYLRLSPYAFLYKQKYSSLKTKILRSWLVKFFVRTFFSTKVFNTLDEILPVKLHDFLRKFYRKYLK